MRPINPRRRQLAGLLALLTCGCATAASGPSLPNLDPAKLQKAKIAISGRVSDERFFAAVTFLANGFQKLPEGGRVWINGETVIPSALQKSGFWYTAHPRQTSSYQLEYVLAAGMPPEKHTIPTRSFGLVLPALVSRAQPLVIPFTGPPLQPGEVLHAEIGNEVDGRLVWNRVLAPVSVGNMISIPMTTLATATLGQARLNVWIVLQSASAAGDFEASYTVGEEKMVWVTN